MTLSSTEAEGLSDRDKKLLLERSVEAAIDVNLRPPTIESESVRRRLERTTINNDEWQEILQKKLAEDDFNRELFKEARECPEAKRVANFWAKVLKKKPEKKSLSKKKVVESSSEESDDSEAEADGLDAELDDSNEEEKKEEEHAALSRQEEDLTSFYNNYYNEDMDSDDDVAFNHFNYYD